MSLGFDFKGRTEFNEYYSKSNAIWSDLQKGIRDVTSKLTQREYYGYDVGADGELTITPNEVTNICWIFGRYLNGSNMGTIAADLKKKESPLPSEAQMEL